jgi:hypothetical protein
MSEYCWERSYHMYNWWRLSSKIDRINTTPGHPANYVIYQVNISDSSANIENCLSFILCCHSSSRHRCFTNEPTGNARSKLRQPPVRALVAHIVQPEPHARTPTANLLKVVHFRGSRDHSLTSLQHPIQLNNALTSLRHHPRSYHDARYQCLVDNSPCQCILE